MVDTLDLGSSASRRESSSLSFRTKFKKADFMSAFFMSEIYVAFFILRYFFYSKHILVLVRIFLFLLPAKFVNLVRMILSMVFHWALVMCRVRFFIVWVVLGCSAFTVQAASMALELTDSHDFYQLSPRQGSLAEQFTTVVNSPPSPIRVSQKRAVRIALFLFGDMNTIENRTLLMAFKKRMRELGIDYRLDTYTDSSQNSSDITPYFKIAEAQPDYIVMTKLGFVQRRFL